MRWIGLTLVVALALGGGAIALFPKMITGDFAEVTIEAIEFEPGLLCTTLVKYSYRLSGGTIFHHVVHDGDRYTAGGEGSPHRLPAWPSHGEGGQYLSLNPELSQMTPEDAKGRLEVHTGERRRIRLGERLYLYNFTGRDGTLYQGFFEIKR